MPVRKIQFWVDEDHPWSNTDFKEFVDKVDDAFICAVKGEIVSYFVGNDEMKKRFDSLHLYKEAKK